MVIAETAIVIPVLAVIVGALAWGVSLVGVSLTMSDIARHIARDVARGVVVDEAVRSAQVHEGTEVSVEERDSWVTVRVARSVRTPLVWLSGLEVPLEQSVTIPREWS